VEVLEVAEAELVEGQPLVELQKQVKVMLVVAELLGAMTLVAEAAVLVE
tara:strand:+ start:461 stop:607 length:147 start_codon:yes stop_codon:yes gene_type:complete